jgi:hypothetical protein
MALRTAHIAGSAALSVAELDSNAEPGVPYRFELKREQANGLTILDPTGEEVLAQYTGPAFWQELPFGPGAPYVSGVVFP